ncbi:lipid droplet-regulating VLDL assembly factor AUP1 isoform X1 [Hydra vulgaris]|uniref:Lipid droplet-regulating VLDL assembly factor AUP1 n=1 Tax=Hydra vulgaris TaxID=6087 RepID=T2M2I9_HYDVU|nr:lipid droplet-regulating VLDL assembly factor AUP1 [Hydra vulgaris]
MSLAISELFNLKRFSSFGPCTAIFFLIYIPIGLVLFALRILISFQYLFLLSLLPKHWMVRRILMRTYCFFMGLVVTSSNSNHRNNGAKVIVSNHISCLDSIAIEAIIPTVRISSESNLPTLFNWLMGYKGFKLSMKSEFKEFLEASSIPFSYFAEGDIACSDKGLLKFLKTPFEFTVGLVQPIAILSERAWLFPVNVSYIHSSFWSDMFWVLYFPFTRFHISFMPCCLIPENKDELEAFVKKIQHDMAFVLGVTATNFTSQDKKEFIKRLKHEEEEKERLASESQLMESLLKSSNNSQMDFDLAKMVEQVKNVLPQVPLTVISENLKTSKHVDKTITQLLDGSVKYTPLNEDEQKFEKSQQDKITAHKVVKSNTFGKSTTARHMSFQERKRLMIEEARRDYLDLHPEYR